MPIITPPFRTSLLTQNGVPFGTDSGDVQTTKDWWLYWQQLTDRSNANSRLAGEGSHADRPDPGSMPDGAIYIEADRGAIYSNEGGTWQYIAGTMYGTLSPDQRPADLGTHDAGFDFRGTDQPREFIWSGTAWVEVTAVQYGPHANRPTPTTIVEGALYVESDRGGVIYQRETPAGTPLWQYLAGTMWGTLSPDQRPTDLGVHDAGFDFRTNVPPPREFIWNQTAWVEITPPQAGDAQIAYGTADLVLTATATAIPGASLVLNRSGRYLIKGVYAFVLLGAGDNGIGIRGEMVANGAPQSAGVLVTAYTGATYMSASQQWIYTAATAGQTVLLRARKDAGGTGTSQTVSAFTSIAATWINP